MRHVLSGYRAIVMAPEGGGVSFSPQADAPQLSVVDATGTEDGLTALNIAADNIDRLSLVLTGLPAGTQVFGDAGGEVPVGTLETEGSVTLRKADLTAIAGQLQLWVRPPADLAGSFTVTATGISTETDGTTASTQAVFVLTVSPTADVVAQGVFTVATIEDQAVAVTPSFRITDADGSETRGAVTLVSADPDMAMLTWHLKGVSLGQATFNAATGRYELVLPTNALVNDDHGLWSVVDLEAVPAANSSRDVDFSLLVETLDGGQSATTLLSGGRIRVHAQADAPILFAKPPVSAEGNVVSLNLSAVLGDVDGSEAFSSLRLKDVPSGWLVRQNGHVLTAGADGYVLDATSLATVTVEAPADFGADAATLLHLEAVVSDTDPDTGAIDSRTVTLDVPVTITPVADEPGLVVRDARGLEEGEITLDIRARQTDADGSETLTLVIEGVPAGASFRQGGVAVGTDLGNGRWGFDATVTAALGTSALTVVPPVNSNTDFTLAVTLVSQDGTSTASVTRDLAVDLRGAADAPVGLPAGGFSFSGTEDQAVAVDLSALAPGDTDGSEQLSVVLSNLPDGFQLTVPAGYEDALIYAGTNRWIVAQSALGVLSLVPPADFSGERTFAADIVVTENDGAVRVDHRSVTVTVDGVADAAIITLNANGTEDVGTPFALSISVGDGASATDPAGEAVTSVVIDGLPAWAALTHPTIADLLQPLGNGTYQVNPAYLGDLALLQQLQVQLPEDFGGSVPGIAIHVTTRDSNGDSRVTDLTGEIQVAAVADIAASHDANGTETAYTLADVHGNSAAGIVLPITAYSSDDDGSETLSYEISGVPEGALLSHGSNLGGGVWHLTATQYDQALAAGGLSVSIPNASAWGLDPATGFTLSVRAVTHEANGSLNGDAVASLNVTWNPGSDSVQHVADPRSIATEFLGNEDSWIPLDLNLSGGDLDGGGETVDVVVTGLPAGAQLNHGSYDIGTGSWVLSLADLADLAVLPPHNVSGDIAIGVRVTVTEAGGDVRSDDFTVTVHVAPVSDAAVVSANAHGLEDQPIALNLSVTPGDTTGTPETITAIRIHGVPTGATLSAGTKNADGTWSLTPAQLIGLTLTPPAQWSGTISLGVEVTSQDGAAAPLTVTRPINVVVAPVADAVTVGQDLPAAGDEDAAIALNLSVAQVDTDGSELVSVMISGLPEGSVLSAGIRDELGNWLLTPGQLVGLTMRPPADWSGTLDLTVTATSLERGSDAVNSVSLPVSVVVNPVADKPVADPVDVTTDEDVPVALSLNLAVSDDSETVGARISGVPEGAIFTNNGVAVGTLVATAGGTATWIIAPADIAGLTLVPPLNAKGTWTFEITPVSVDGTSTYDGEASPMVVHVNPVSDAPTLSVTGASGNEDTRIPLDIRASLTDSSEILSATIRDIPSGATLWWNGSQIAVVNGVATLNAAQLSGLSLAIQPRGNSDVDFVLRVQAFSQDGTADKASSQELLLPVTVLPVSDLPNISPNALSGNEDSRITLPTATLADTDGSETLTEVKISGIPEGATLRSGETVITVINGTAVLSADLRTNLTLQTKQDYSGSFSITYSATSQDGNATPATRTRIIPVTVNPVSDAPIVHADPAQGLEDTRIALTISATTTDIDGSETLTVSISGIPTGSVLRAGETVITITNGVAMLTPAQLADLTIQPPLNYETDFTLSVTAISKDGTAAPASATVQLSVDVIPVEDAPELSIPLADQTATEDLAFQYVIPAGSFTDPDLGDVLTYQATLPDGSALPAWLHFDPITGTFSGLPENDDVGSFEVRVTATDRAGLSVTDTFVLTVDNVNDAPVAVDDAFTGFEGETREITATELLANDYDVDVGDAIRVVRVFDASHGTVSLDPVTGKVTFIPELGFVGEATFQYEIADNDGAVSVATATIDLLPRPEIQAGALRIPVEGAAAWHMDAAANGYGPLTFALAEGPAHGVVKLAADGTYQYFADAGYQGTDSFLVTVTNALGGKDTARVNVGVGVDIAGTDFADSFEGKAGADVFIGGSGNDLLTGNRGDDTLIGGDGDDTLSGGSGDNVLDGGTGNDTAVFGGTVSDYIIERVTLADGTQAVKVTSRATATVTIDVETFNDPPVARDDSAVAREDATLTIGSASLLANDTDVDGDLLSIVGNGNAAHGTVTAVRDANGNIVSFSYKPAADFHGEDSFTYIISDSHGGLSSATVHMVVQEANDAPMAVNDSVSLLEDTTQAISAASLLGNDTDVDGDSLSIVGNTNAAHGTVTAVKDASGNITQFNYTPYGNYFGADSFTYTTSDGRGASSTATVQLNVTNVNDAPIANSDYIKYVHRYGGINVSFSTLLANDKDPDEDTLIITKISATGGYFSIHNGYFYYQAYSEGTSYVYYDVSDGHGGVATGKLTINAYHTPFVVDLDGNGATLVNLADSTAYFDVNGDDFRERTTWAGPNDAILAYDRNGDGIIREWDEVVLSGLVTDPNATGTFLALPSLDSNGDGVLDSRDAEWSKLGLWRDADQDGINDEGEFQSLDAMGVASIPLAADTTGEVRDGTVITAKGSVVFTDGTTAELVDAEFAYEPTGIRTDADGNIAIGTSQNVGASLSSGALIPSGIGLMVIGVDTAAHGTVTLENGTVNFVPDTDFSGQGTFVVHYSDGSSRIVTVEVASVTAPVAEADSVQGSEDSLLVISAATLLANDHDAEGDTLTITGFTEPAHASITAIRDAQGVITGFEVTSAANFNGSDTFTYTIGDGHGGFSTQTVALSFAAINDGPVAHGDDVLTVEDHAVIIDIATLLSNDTDVENDALTLTAVTNALGGTVTMDAATGTVTFTPSADFHGRASFDYVISDGHGGTSSSTVTVVVAEANDSPRAVNDTATTTEDQPVVVDVLANDTDPDGDPVTVLSVYNVTGGTVSVNSDGTCTFTPDPNSTATGSFQYAISDGTSILTGIETIKVGDQVIDLTANNAPFGKNDAALTGLRAPVVISVASLLANDWDFEGDALTIETVDSVTSGTAVFDRAAGTITFIPTGTGPMSFQYVVSDGHGGTARQTVQLSLGTVQATITGADTQVFISETDTGYDRAVATGTGSVALDLGVASIRVGEGGAGNDRLYSTGSAAVTLSGGAGNDTLTGGTGNDTLDGGTGNDTLFGGAGADVIRLGLGGGQDLVLAGAGSSGDTIVLGAGLTLAHVAFQRVGNDLVLRLLGSGDQVTLQNWYVITDRITSIRLADGTSVPITLATIGTGAGETITGTTGNDTLIGLGGNDTLNGGAGDDTYIFSRGDGQDTITDSAGNGDVLQFGAGITVADLQARLVGGDLVVSVAPANGTTLPLDQWTDKITLKNWTTLTSRVEVFRFADGTTLYASGIVGLLHTQGNDTVTWTESPFVLDGLGGNDIITGGTYDDTLSGGDGNDSLSGAGGADILSGDDGDDVLWGGIGADTINGGSGLDYARYEISQSAVSVNLATGQGFGGEAEGDHLIAIEGVVGSLYGDILVGDAGSNYLFGQDGNDTLAGGAGDDVFWGGVGSDALDGGSGFDYARYDNSQSGVTVSLVTGLGSGGEAEGDRLSGVEALYGSRYRDILIGDATGNYLFGAGGNDTLSGGAGDDLLWGGSGADLLDGGDGIDQARYEDSTAGVTVDLGSGKGSGGDAAGDVLTGVESVVGSNFADTLLGSAGVDTIFGGAGNDYLVGRDGDDLLAGGVGADMIDGGAGFDLAAYWDSTTGITVDLRSGTGSGGDAAGDVLTGIEGVVGSNYTDTLLGSAGAELLNALVGDDLLDGREGNDSIFGGAGNDTLLGCAGDDLLWGGSGADTLSGGDGFDQARYEDSAGGVTVNLATGQGFGGDAAGDVLSGIEGVVGSNFADTLLGGGGADQLMGLDGNDTLSGEGGDDVLWGGNGADVLDGGEGLDYAHYEISQSAVSVNLAMGQGFGGEAEGDHLIAIEGVVGSLYGDILVGDAGSNYLFGQDGNDTLAGGAGDDVFWGGVGSDALDGGSGFDYARYDNSQSGVTVSLVTGLGSGGEAEGDRLSGVEALYGSQYRDILIGDAAGNYLFGAGGNDTLSGGAGDDLLWGGSGADLLDGGDGIDQARYEDSTAGVTVNLATGQGFGGDAAGDILTGIESVVGSNFTDTLQGGGGADQLMGLGGNDVIDGSNGSDTIWGGDGNDTLIGGNGADTLIGGDGYDQAYYFDSTAGVVVDLEAGTGSGGDATGDVLLGIENVVGSNYEDTLLGDGNANLLQGAFGNDFIDGRGGNDTLYGGVGNDTLLGGDGDDILNGKADADMLIGGAGSDTYIVGDGADTVSNIGQGADGDIVQFASTVTADQLWFTQSGDDLLVSVIGTGNSVLIDDWYLSDSNHVSQFVTADGRSLADSQVHNLVSAMATMTMPGNGQTTLTTDQHAVLDTVIAANWSK